MTGKDFILIVLGVFAIAVAGTIAVFFGRIIWARRSPASLKEFERRETEAAKARRDIETERIRLGKPSWVGRCFGAIFLLVGVYVAVLSGRQIYEIGSGQFWTAAKCTILSSSIGISGGSSRSVSTFHPEVSYSYSFDGRNYTGNRFDLSDNYYLSRDSARRAIEKYPAGATVDCYINPSNVAESVLDNSFLRFPFFKSGLGLLITFGLGGYLLYASRRKI